MKRILVVECMTLVAVGALGLVGGVGAYLRSDARTQSSLLQPGVYVIALSVVLIVTALVYGGLGLARYRAASAPQPQPVADDRGGLTVWLVYAAIVLYGVLIPILGYLVATLLFLAAEFRLLGVRSWTRTALLTIIVTAVFYGLFVHYAEMVFPRGIFVD